MVKVSKRVKLNDKKTSELSPAGLPVSLSVAVDQLLAAQKVKFDESVEVAIKTGLDPKQTDQLIRGSVSLPHGIGKKVRVAAFVGPELMTAARAAGATLVGAEEITESLSKGGIDFDVMITSPALMKDVSKFAKVLGPKGLMPSPKAGTVTTDIPKGIKELVAGRLEFKLDKIGACIANGVGKVSFGKEKIIENIRAYFDAIIKARPSSAKQFLLSAYIATTMGPGIKIDISEFSQSAGA